MRAALVKDGVVENVIEIEGEYVAIGYEVVPSEIAGPGWAYGGNGEFAPPGPPPPVFPDLPRADFFQAALALGVTRQMIRDQINEIPQATQREAALIEFEERPTFRRDNALLVQIASALGKTVEEIDAAWLSSMGDDA